MAAPRIDVTTPIFRGNNGKGRFLSCLKSPSLSSLAFSFSRAAYRAEARRLHVVGVQLVDAVAFKHRDASYSDHLSALGGDKVRRAASVLHIPP